MKLSAPFLLLLAALGVAEAASHDNHARMARHHAVAARNDPIIRRTKNNSRCKVRPTSTLVSSSTHHTTSTHSSSHAAQTTQAAPAASNDKSNNDNKSSSNNNNNSKSSSGSNSGSLSQSLGTVSGLIKITSSSCGSPGATEEITPTHGPNGNIDWLNCGVEDGGWNPPMVKVSDIVSVDLQDAVKDANSPFKSCEPYIDLFTQYANQHGIPPILIASIAMQESSCDPNTVGGAGEQGLMQITKDKCGGAPNGNCKDPDFNIRTGTAFFAQTLDDNGGSLLLTLGNYNGWPKHMTYAQATAAASSSCCRCQNNLDYLMQTLNGWVLNKDPYTSVPRIGKYFNLDVCG
ncbi:lysozyme-like domain-containing protein [Trametes punicea]|nr:lysozyme-like domain-containing protein [Trametes punicea]